MLTIFSSLLMNSSRLIQIHKGGWSGWSEAGCYWHKKLHVYAVWKVQDECCHTETKSISVSLAGYYSSVPFGSQVTKWRELIMCRCTGYHATHHTKPAPSLCADCIHVPSSRGSSSVTFINRRTEGELEDLQYNVAYLLWFCVTVFCMCQG